MALKLNEAYPGRFNNPSPEYPQGSFKNRTTPTAEDGSYFEQQWANDHLAFLSSLLADAEIEPNGLVDEVGASQYFDAFLASSLKLLRSAAANATELLRGVLRVGTQAEVNAGALDDVAVTPKKLRQGFNASFTVNGYIVFPSWLGGLILQWGGGGSRYEKGVTYSFPIAFTSQVFSMVANHRDGVDSAATPVPRVIGLTQFNLKWSTSTTIIDIYWIALGR